MEHQVRRWRTVGSLHGNAFKSAVEQMDAQPREAEGKQHDRTAEAVETPKLRAEPENAGASLCRPAAASYTAPQQRGRGGDHVTEAPVLRRPSVRRSVGQALLAR